MNEIPYLPIAATVIAVGFFLVMRLRRQQNQKRLQAAITAGATIIDVRSPGEFSSGHYQNAINIPVDRLANKLIAIGPTDTPVIVYCASGMRSAAAAQTLRAAGYQQVLNAGPLSGMPS